MFYSLEASLVNLKTTNCKLYVFKNQLIIQILIYGYPYGQQQRIPENRVKLGEGAGNTKKDSQNEASKSVLKKLATFNIHEIIPDPFKKN